MIFNLKNNILIYIFCKSKQLTFTTIKSKLIFITNNIVLDLKLYTK